MAHPPADIAVIIPAFNEEGSIRGVVEDVREAMSRLGEAALIIVVNDGSSDGTVAALRGLPCVVLELPINIGIGGAMQLGFQCAFTRGCSIAVQVDGDGQHPAGEIGALLAPLRDDRADVVIGSRFLADGGSQSTFGRRLGIRYFNALQGILIGRRITDSTSGFRALNRKALALCVDTYPDQFPEPEAIVLFARQNLRLLEVPVRMNDRRAGQSSISPLGSMLYMFKVTLAMLMAVVRTHH